MSFLFRVAHGMFILQTETIVNISKCKYSIVKDNPSEPVPGSSEDSMSEVGLDSFALVGALSSNVDKLERTLQKDSMIFLEKSDEMSSIAKQAIKEVVDYSLKPEFCPGTSKMQQSSIYVDGFDAEQVWLQLDTISNTAMNHAKRVLKRHSKIDRVIPEDVEEALDGMCCCTNMYAPISDSYPNYSIDSELLNGRMADGGEEEDTEEEDDVSNGSEEEPSDSGEFLENEYSRQPVSKSKSQMQVEDEFMKLDEMEAFVREAEELEGRDVGEDDEEMDEDAIDALLENAANIVKKGKRPSKSKRDVEEFDTENVDLSSDPMANAKYEDFFGPKKAKNGKKSVRFELSEETDEDKSEEGLSEEMEYSNSESEDEYAQADGGFNDDLVSEEELAEDIDEQLEDSVKSIHSKKLESIVAKIQKMEEAAIGERDWFMAGEVSASSRPKNSALEIDLDFETTMKPPPQPTEEGTKDLEELIKKRIADHHFDDVIAFKPATEKKSKTTIELDDVKSSKGLGEIYEEDYIASVSAGALEDKDKPIRELAKTQFIDLCAKLDQLSHGQFKPVPSIEEVTFKVDVPAIMMEEATPAFISTASMQKPEEVYKAGQVLHKNITIEDEEGEEQIITKRDGMMQKGGIVKSEVELTREEKKRRRAAKKRAAKKGRASKDESRVNQALASGRQPVPGRKSEADAEALRKLGKNAKSTSKGNFTKSREVFAKLNEIASGVPSTQPPETKKHIPSMHLKL